MKDKILSFPHLIFDTYVPNLRKMAEEGRQLYFWGIDERNPHEAINEFSHHGIGTELASSRGR